MNKERVIYQVLTKAEYLLDTCPTLDDAMKVAKQIGQFVIIRGPDGMEFVGMFGVDTVADGKTPDGHAYDWNKRSRMKRPKKGEWIRAKEED
jgi:hypothetical protein